MTTYKVLLVDDEEEVRNAIEQRINWEELGFEVIGKAQNGVTGTDIINNSSDEQQYIKTGTYYGQIEANVQLINRMPYDNVYKNDPQSVYQAQASMISPLVIKLLEQ